MPSSRWKRIPQANRDALVVPRGKSLFDATDAGELVDSLVYHVPTGAIFLGKAMTHQELLDRFGDDRQIDNYVRADLFRRPFLRLEFDLLRAAVAFDDFSDPNYPKRIWDNIFDAIDACGETGLPDDIRIFVGELEVTWP